MSEPTISFAGYTFLASKGCAVCRHVMEGAPVLLFVHETGGGLQMLCGAADHVDADRRWVHVHHVLQAQPELLELPTVDFGQEAERDSRESRWRVAQSPT